jgi:hypothetical protein
MASRLAPTAGGQVNAHSSIAAAERSSYIGAAEPSACGNIAAPRRWKNVEVKP